MFVQNSSSILHRATWVLWLLGVSAFGWGQSNWDDMEGVDALQMVPKAFVSNEMMLTAKVNDLASWYDEEYQESYVLVGCENGTAFFKMLPGGVPVYMGKLPTASVSSLWRDIKVIHHHAYIVSEAPLHGTQIFDLTALRQWEPNDGLLEWEVDALIGGPSVAHNAVSFEESDQLILVGSNWMGGGAVIFDVASPEAPQLLGGASEWGYFHDAHALIYDGPDVEHAGKHLLFAAGESGLFILDITDASDISLIAQAGYDTPHYGHQVWVSSSHDHAFFGDELDESNEGGGTRTMVFDLTDLDAPFVFEEFEASVLSTDHNQYSHGEWLFQSNYTSGLRMLSDAWPNIPSLEERGHFDPVDDGNLPGFQGAWSHVVLEEEGLIAFTSIDQGLWVVSPEFAVLTDVQVDPCVDETLIPWELTLELMPGWAFPVTVNLEGMELDVASPMSWTMVDSGSFVLAFDASCALGARPKLRLESQRSTWTLDILSFDDDWSGTFMDADADGYGNPGVPVWGCEDGVGMALSPFDCQDWNPNTYPLAPELCDGWDNDCDGELDEETTQLAWYLDEDGDGFGTSDIPAVWSCVQVFGRSLLDGDCNDNEANMYPGALPTASGVDNDCNGVIDESEWSDCPGDFNGDGWRNTTDMLHLLSSFGCQQGCTASMDASDDIDIQDLLVWLMVYSVPCDP